MKTPARHHVVLIVVYTMALTSVLYICVLAWCTVAGVNSSEMLGAFTHVGDTVTGALVALLARTSSEPQKTEIVNTPDQPVPTTTET